MVTAGPPVTGTLRYTPLPPPSQSEGRTLAKEDKRQPLAVRRKVKVREATALGPRYRTKFQLVRPAQVQLLKANRHRDVGSVG